MSGTNDVVFLKGKNVVLRPVEKGDLPHFLQFVNDPDIRDFLVNFLPLNMNNEEAWFESLSKEKQGSFALTLVCDGKVIGNMGVHRINWRDRVATTGAVIGEKSLQRKGIGTEAKILLLNHLFYTLNLHKICSQVIQFNGRSLRYAEKCGYKPEGILRKHIFRKGQYWDLHNLAVFEEDFRPIWERYQKEI